MLFLSGESKPAVETASSPVPVHTLHVASGGAGAPPTPFPDVGVIGQVDLDLGLWALQEHRCAWCGC